MLEHARDLDLVEAIAQSAKMQPVSVSLQRQ
ncbi:MAG: hypothetical protein ACXVA7_22665, partial [Isosphaeraceae bacterium]